MRYFLNTPVDILPGIGRSAVADFKRLGIATVSDLLWYLPFRYDDHSEVKQIADAHAGDTVTLQGRISAIKSRRSFKRRLTITQAVLEDETGQIKVVWFNQPYIEKSIALGDAVSLAGKISDEYGLTMVSPVYEKIRSKGTVHTGRIVPIYPLRGSLTQKRIRTALHSGLSASSDIKEWLPDLIMDAEPLPSISKALTDIHFPPSHDDLALAADRIKFEELLLHQILFLLARRKLKKFKSYPIQPDENEMKKFLSALPFKLTSAQSKAIGEVLVDLEKPNPMNRLLQGDVGSGKTIVAAATAFAVSKAGRQIVYLAPTEILASQQHETLLKLLPGTDVALCTRSKCAIGSARVSRESVESEVNAGLVSVLVATHAVLHEGFSPPNLALVIVDEQHRFGVRQRQRLLEKHSRKGVTPHLLSMSATPIPRSLALCVFGDLDLSILDELPAGRKPITTSIVNNSEDEKKMYEIIEQEIKNNRRVYVVCPLIDPSDNFGAQSVTEVSEELRKGQLGAHKIEVLHGKMKSDEKDRVISDFANGKTDILVSTTVVEVGVNVPQATVMLVVGAERFGLAQLHQLRGRVGRADIQSYCFLKPSDQNPFVKKRLLAVVATNDGFELAERDLEFRGPGNLFGSAQSGFPDFKLATFADTALMKKARDWANVIFEESPDLKKWPEVLVKLKEQVEKVHFE
ncbi:MAG: hypothetical protein ACD_76C00041G0002 [uncultured bacterium]|nr:MAG: hypothetical protein ACD_76C00041G0002 [uncultured bacterium]HBD05445.1 DNA helicase RecG [Candidatus Uhrbacteria bacterium]